MVWKCESEQRRSTVRSFFFCAPRPFLCSLLRCSIIRFLSREAQHTVHSSAVSLSSLCVLVTAPFSYPFLLSSSSSSFSVLSLYFIKVPLHRIQLYHSPRLFTHSFLTSSLKVQFPGPQYSLYFVPFPFLPSLSFSVILYILFIKKTLIFHVLRSPRYTRSPPLSPCFPHSSLSFLLSAVSSLALILVSVFLPFTGKVGVFSFFYTT